MDAPDFDEPLAAQAGAEAQGRAGADALARAGADADARAPAEMPGVTLVVEELRAPDGRRVARYSHVVTVIR